MPLLEAIDIQKTFPRGDKLISILRNASIAVSAGEFVWLRGDNGEGKTTFLRILAGLLDADYGIVRLSEADISRLPWFLRPLSFIDQNPHLTIVPSLTVRENLLLSVVCAAPTFRRFSANGKWTKVENAVEKLGLKKILLADKGEFRLGRELSAGQGQCLSLAMSWLKDAKVILADEPISNLDKHHAEVCLCALRELSQKAAVIIVSHDERAQDYCTSEYEIKDGCIEKISSY